MEAGTFKTRLVALLQKSRQAVRLYTEMERSQDKLNYSDLQIFEWKNVNLELVRELCTLLDNFYNQKDLISRVFALIERFQVEQISLNTDMEKMKSELSLACNNADFVKSADLSLKLVAIKSKNQALQAVLHELKNIMTKSNLTRPACSYKKDEEVVSTKTVKSAKIIPIDSLQKAQMRG